jgi:hypothetical protein
MALNTTFTSGQILTAAQMNNLPWGVAGYVKGTGGNFTANTTTTDVTGLTVSWTAVSGRLYQVDFSVQARKLGGTGFIEFIVANSANTVIYDFFDSVADNDYQSFSWSGVLTGLSGAQTIKIRALTGAGTATVYSSSANPSSLVIKDIGLA